jgi:drug/metabolite transporter (DMT)-like permease
MLPVLFGLGAAAGYGASDFLAGLAARRAPALAVALVSKIVAGAALILLAALAGEQPHGPAVAWGAAAGVALGIGSLAFYRALAVGRMGVVAAVMGVGQAIVPFAAGLALGERPSLVAVIGAIVATIAIVLVLKGKDEAKDAAPGISRSASGVLLGSLAGFFYGLFLILLDQAKGGGALVPAAAAMLSGAITVLVVATVLRRQMLPSLAALPSVIAVGLCSAAATWSFVLGVREGLLSIVAVVEGLSPAVTAICAFLFARERLSRLQLTGFAAALTGVLLMAAG